MFAAASYHFTTDEEDPEAPPADNVEPGQIDTEAVGRIEIRVCSPEKAVDRAIDVSSTAAEPR
ncbi:hypothetical protein BVRB_037720 [Beta vulgaris subsp. vulgaris]|uniref:Uncharacterized protein n=1 Tax=Beta vulgaris subsp. vulgaris TaxID=3555 RepID=A0A0J7YNV8_BETVV|nr:hypothetical protein BVRB_037720 [Beta vulgaris subsp. vulgaris]